MDQKSTPVSEYVCPNAARSVEKHSVTKREDGKYECVCGCVFEWQDQLHWRLVDLAPANQESGSTGDGETG